VTAVPSENKRDQRTIEQVMADSRARKKQKTELNKLDEPVNEQTEDTDHWLIDQWLSVLCVREITDSDLSYQSCLYVSNLSVIIAGHL